MRRLFSLLCLTALITLPSVLAAPSVAHAQQGDAPRQAVSSDDVRALLMKGDFRNGSSLATPKQPESGKGEQEAERYTSSHKYKNQVEKMSVLGVEATVKRSKGPEELSYDATPAQVGYSRNRPGLR